MSASPIILALETSQRGGGVALSDAAGTHHVESLLAERRHDDDLLPAIDRLLDRTTVDRHAFEAIALSIGPGGFTGLRIAVSTVKMMAYALGCPVIAVPSAIVVAEGSIDPETPIGARALVPLASKRGSVWMTTLEREPDRWRIIEEGLREVDAVDVPADTIVVADAHQPDALRMGAIEARYDAAACLREALRRFSDGETDDPLTLTPMYPREPEAVSLWNARRRSDH